MMNIKSMNIKSTNMMNKDIILKPSKDMNNNTVLDKKYIENYHKFLLLERNIKLDKLRSFYIEYILNRRNFYRLEYKTINILYNIWNYLINHKNYTHLLADFSRFYNIFIHYIHNNKNITILDKLKTNINDNINKICRCYISLLPIYMLKELHEIYNYTKYDLINHKTILKIIKNSNSNSNSNNIENKRYYNYYYNTNNNNIVNNTYNDIFEVIDDAVDVDVVDDVDDVYNSLCNSNIDSGDENTYKMINSNAGDDAFIPVNINCNEMNSVINEYNNYKSDNDDHSSSGDSDNEYYN